MTLIDTGALCFGVVVGWVTSRTLRRATPGGLSDIATVIGAVSGAAITGIYKPSTDAFGFYSIGLLVGFFGYLGLSIAIAKQEKQPIGDWLGSEAVPTTWTETAPWAVNPPGGPPRY